METENVKQVSIVYFLKIEKKMVECIIYDYNLSMFLIQFIFHQSNSFILHQLQTVC